jgi:hypothetical protein
MTIYLWVALGIAISVILPIIRAFLPKPPGQLSTRNWAAFKPYVWLGVFSLVVAILIIAAMGDQLDTWQKAVIAGYAWDSTVQKLAI